MPTRTICSLYSNIDIIIEKHEDYINLLGLNRKSGKEFKLAENLTAKKAAAILKYFRLEQLKREAINRGLVQPWAANLDPLPEGVIKILKRLQNQEE